MLNLPVPPDNLRFKLYYKAVFDDFCVTQEGCEKTFAKQYQFDAHMKLHMHRSCHMCGKVSNE